LGNDLHGEPSDLILRFSDIVRNRIIQADRIPGGRNTRIYQLATEDGQKLIGKVYFSQGANGRNRAHAEFTSLQFMWTNGLRNIPRPISADPNAGIAVYEFVEGTKLDVNEISEANIDAAAGFLIKLEGIKTRRGSLRLPIASEAGFSFEELRVHVLSRLARLLALPCDKEPYSSLDRFLTGKFAKSFETIEQWSRRHAELLSLPWQTQIELNDRTLSPSDFGFHNALKRSGGDTVFLDFEYFGWDDPAKMTSDFLFHPAMDLSEQLKSRFTVTLLKALQHIPSLSKRVRVVYPLCGLKWCLLLLNEFIPEGLARRDFAGTPSCDIVALQFHQLRKAERLLERINIEYEDFPYGAQTV
jgi:hypothetical protein